MSRLFVHNTPTRVGLALALLLGFGSPARSQDPGLIAKHFTLNLPQKQALARGSEAVRAAGLQEDEPTVISRGGRGGKQRVLIHCLESGSGSAIDIEVASNGPGAEMYALLDFLEEYMRNGKALAISKIDGEWETEFGKMRLFQTGNRVTGTYETSGGTLEGTLSGNVLRFQWKQTNNSMGAGRFRFAADGRSFEGAWTYESDPDKAVKRWNGTRPK